MLSRRVVAGLLVLGAAAPAAWLVHRLVAAGDGGDWRPLFNGVDLNGWHCARAPSPWSVVGGELRHAPSSPGKGNFDRDLLTDAVFEDFTLHAEWSIGKSGNSGIYYLTGDPGALDPRRNGEPGYLHALEYQIRDDDAYAVGNVGLPIKRTGALEALYAPGSYPHLPLGAFNASEIVKRGDTVEHWLNGALIVRYTLGSDDFRRRVAASKFAGVPGFGVARQGRIGLQDYNTAVSFRDIRIKIP